MSESLEERSVRFVKEMEEILEAQIASGFLENLMGMFVHSGFDPSHTLRLLSTTANFDAKEIQKLCWVYALRGTNTDKILRTTTFKAQAKLKTLFKKYNVKPRVGEGDRNTITLSRIAACFPHYVCRICQLSKKRVIPVDLDSLPLSYPKAMTTQVFASLIPTSDKSLATMMLNAHLYYLVLFDEVVNKKSSQWNKVVKYQKAAYQSTILTEENKIKCCLALKVLCKDDQGRLELMPEVALAAFQIADLRECPTIPDGYFLSDWHESFLGMGLSVSFLEDLYEQYGYTFDDIKEGKDKENSGTTGRKKRPRSSSVDTSAKRLKATESSPTSEDGKGSEAASSSGRDHDEKAREKKSRTVKEEEEKKEEKDDASEASFGF